MNELYEKSLHTLELDRVLELLADTCVTEDGKALALSLRPSIDADDVRLFLQETSDACHMVEIKGSPAFREVHGIRRRGRDSRRLIGSLFLDSRIKPVS